MRSLRQSSHLVAVHANGGTGSVSGFLHSSLARSGRRLAMFLCLVGVTVLTSTTIALAYWAPHGSGSSNAAAGTIVAPSVAAFVGGDAPSSALIPGGSSDVVVRVDNPNPYSVKLTAISLNGSITAAGGAGTCASSDVTVSFPSVPSITVTSGSHLFDLPGAASMSISAQNGCQGATFDIPVSASFQK
jgi:hypothetical protein